MAHAHVYWIAAAVVLVFVEVLTGTFYFMALGAAASGAAAAAYFNFSSPVQIGAAAVIAAVGAVLVFRHRTRAKRAAEERKEAAP